jgi:hypothetical protein
MLVVLAGSDAPERHASNEGDDHGDETREGKHLSIRLPQGLMGGASQAHVAYDVSLPPVVASAVILA